MANLLLRAYRITRPTSYIVCNFTWDLYIEYPLTQPNLLCSFERFVNSPFLSRFWLNITLQWSAVTLLDPLICWSCWRCRSIYVYFICEYFPIQRWEGTRDSVAMGEYLANTEKVVLSASSYVTDKKVFPTKWYLYCHIGHFSPNIFKEKSQ